MQVMSMSSPSMSDAADTPISGSGESSNPQSPVNDESKQILDFSRKDNFKNNGNGISEKILEIADNERSVTSSPATLVPTPRSTPPMNGILTPPNDVDAGSETTKVGKPGGRLKFFKDGILCLELTHHGEGERTKWVQIRSKTVFPTLVHTVKEATIPCHSTPSSFASPSSLTHNNRVESSTSHSLSDDASSMLSSPRTRENLWKQPVPQRGASACLQFFFKPAPCVLKLRSKLEELSQSQDQKRKRWPYYFRRTDDIFLKLKNCCVQCCCDESSRVLMDSNVSGINNNNDKNSNDENLLDSKTSILETKLCQASTKSVYRRKTSVSLHDVVGQLEKTAAVTQKRKEEKLRSNGEMSDLGKKSGRVKTPPTVTPKKRLFNEVEPKDSCSVRPKKKSPNRTFDVGKTILNIPGLNNEFYKRQTPQKSNKSPGRSPPLTGGADVYNYKSSKKLSESPSQKRKSLLVGAKSISPGTSSNAQSMLKPGLSAELLDHFSPLPGRNPSHRISEDHLSSRHPSLVSELQEQKYLQQQTVSKAISYTINSLLGTGSGSDSPSGLPTKQESQKSSKESGLSPHSSFSHSTNLNSRHNSPVRSIPGGGRPEDQKSFLRHLLDTSDPIPSVKPSERTNKNVSRSSNVVNQNNGGKSTTVVKSASSRGGLGRTSQIEMETSKNSKSSGLSNSAQHHQSSKSSISDVQQNLATNIALQQLMSSFPLGMVQPYDLIRNANANPHSTEALTAAAAAALQQYGGLLPGNFFNPVGNPMAAAMAASYFGMVQMPNFPLSSAATQPPSVSQSSPTPPPSSKGTTSTTRKNLEPNQRSLLQRPGIANGHPPVSSPSFRSSSARISQISPARPAISAISSVDINACEALNLSAKKKAHSEEVIDLDAPLDLCKKSSR